jgi:hypothetical protein
VSRLYTVPIATPTSIAVATTDLFEVIPAANKPVRLHGINLFNTTDFGDAQDEVLDIRLVRGGTAITSGSGGAAVTPVPVVASDGAAGFTAETFNTTAATFTTSTIVADTRGWQVRLEKEFYWTPESMHVISAANGGFVIRLGSAPADAITIGGTLYIEEIA